MDLSPAFPPQCTREAKELVCFSNMEPSILYGLAQNGHFNVNILNEQSKRSINIHSSETIKEHEVGFGNGSSHQRRWSVFPVLLSMMEPSGSSYLLAPQPSLALVTAERSLRYWQEASYLLREMIVHAESTCELVQ